MKVIDKFITLLNIDTSISDEYKNQFEKEFQFWNILSDFLIDEGVSPDKLHFLPIIHNNLKGDFENEINFYKEKIEIAYKNRCNLLVKFSEKNKNKVLLNCHIDTVPPFFGLEKFDNIDQKIKARGSVDIKSGIFLMISLIKKILNNKLNIDFLFVIDEEIGGMGTKSFVSIPEFSNIYKSVVVFEPTQSIPYSANRGAQWFEFILDSSDNLYSKIVCPLLKITNDSRKNIIEDDKSKIQLCFGVINDFGDIPSSAIYNLTFETNFELPNIELILEDYPDLKYYLINSNILPNVKLKSEKHYEIESLGGHMGSLTRGADAFIWFSILQDYCEKRGYLFKSNFIKENIITLKGGIGIPLNTPISSVRHLIKKNILNAEVNFVGVSNESYSSSENILFKKFKKAIPSIKFNSMWNASCDSRLFRNICSEVITFGPDSLDKAHTIDESIDVIELNKSLKILNKILCELD